MSKRAFWIWVGFAFASALAAGAAAWNSEQPAVGIGAGAVALMTILGAQVATERTMKRRATKKAAELDRGNPGIPVK